ncbi:MAG: polysaccharide deacetylase family protein [Gemmatimonadetes bacterium]|nr:polysaccharide deacetylase family protein [Gemmatimonadota bacterium]MDA1102233.1 polysaccharide deacetylase family protein [Gemmatimonadota bacterium]
MNHQHALTKLEGRTDRILAWASEQGIPVSPVPEHARPVEDTELDPSRLSKGITLGAHTWSHANLAALGPDAILDELVLCKDWLSERSSRQLPWLAYPYGLRNTSAAAVAADCFEGALLVSGGRAVRRGRRVAERALTPRLNVPRGLSLEGLSLRLSGFLT